MSMMHSTTPQAAVKVASNRRGLLVVGAVVAGLIGYSAYVGTPWVGTAQPAATVATVAESGDGAIAVGDTFTFAQEFGDVVLTVASVDGDTVTVTDAEGDETTLTVAQLTGGTLPASNIEANADHMMSVIAQRVASGYYERNKGVNGAHGK